VNIIFFKRYLSGFTPDPEIEVGKNEKTIFAKGRHDCISVFREFGWFESLLS
jgi:hypothetical protein